MHWRRISFVCAKIAEELAKARKRAGWPSGDSKAFNLDSPGMIQIVQMEPGVYQYMKKHKRYADGTMLALSFYNAQNKPEPVVDGVVQKDLASFEIHILDSEKYAEKRAFYIFANGDDSAAMLPEGNSCVGCHIKGASLNGTFAQFYPVLRDKVFSQALRQGE